MAFLWRKTHSVEGIGIFHHAPNLTPCETLVNIGKKRKTPSSLIRNQQVRGSSPRVGSSRINNLARAASAAFNAMAFLWRKRLTSASPSAEGSARGTSPRRRPAGHGDKAPPSPPGGSRRRPAPVPAPPPPCRVAPIGEARPEPLTPRKTRIRPDPRLLRGKKRPLCGRVAWCSARRFSRITGFPGG